MILTFPWPPKELSPNARVHWRTLSTAKKKYKTDCMWVCKASRAKPECEPNVFCRVVIRFIPPDNLLRDLDNCIASFKAGQDGMAEALGFNDRIFQCDYKFGKPVKPGSVTVEFLDQPIKTVRVAA